GTRLWRELTPKQNVSCLILIANAKKGFSRIREENEQIAKIEAKTGKNGTPIEVVRLCEDSTLPRSVKHMDPFLSWIYYPHQFHARFEVFLNLGFYFLGGVSRADNFDSHPGREVKLGRVRQQDIARGPTLKRYQSDVGPARVLVGTKPKKTLDDASADILLDGELIQIEAQDVGEKRGKNAHSRD